MSDDPENLTLVLLREMRAEARERFNVSDAKMDAVRADIVEIRQRLGFLEGGYASLSTRVDRVVGAVERIERRLGLVEA